MSGGVAYVLDIDGRFRDRCNREMVDLDPFDREEEIDLVHELIARHAMLTGSAIGERVLANWRTILSRFVAIVPKDYKRVHASSRRADGRSEARPLQVAV
jgi:glutamate synthase domain-containing protein 3